MIPGRLPLSPIFLVFPLSIQHLLKSTSLSNDPIPETIPHPPPSPLCREASHIMLDNESRRNRRWLIPSNDPRFREIYDITRNWEQRRVLGSPLSRRRLLLTSNPRPRLTIFGCARDRKIAREPFLIYGRSGQHFSGTLAGGPSHNSEIEARFYVEFKGILPMRATRIDGTLPDESSLPPSLLHGNEIFPPDSIIFTPPAFIFHPAASSGRPFPVALHVPVSQFQGSSRDKARVESPLLPSLSPDAADSLWVSAHPRKLLSWVLFYLKVAASKNLLVSLFSRMSLSSLCSSLLQFRPDTCFRVLYGFSRNFLFPSFQSLRNFPLYKLIISTLSPALSYSVTS